MDEEITIVVADEFAFFETENWEHLEPVLLSEALNSIQS